MSKSPLLFFITVLFISACSPFNNKDIRKPIADGLTPKTLYSNAEDKLDSGAVEQAIDEFKILLEAYPGSKYAIQARLDIAYNLLKSKKYNQAISQLNLFIDKYPSISSSPYAFYLRGVAAEEKSTSILDKIVTDSAQRDVQSVRDAYSYFVLLIEKYPNSKYSDEALTKLIKLKNILSRHEFYVAIYYTKKGSYIGAINRSKYIIENFPNTTVIPDSLHLMASNYDAIGADELASSARKILNTNFPSYTAKYSLK
tara:strand:+ start:135 stop:902 length:768 start_codon:yes stop_codon:yes gene_type:complete